MKIEVEKTPVDSGYAWVILGACTFMYSLMIGGVKSYGILYTEFLDFFDTGAGNTAWIGSMCTLFLLGLGPFSNYLVELWTFRWVTFIGGVLVGLGYLLSSFVQEMELMYLTFGVVAGVGYGLLFSPCVTIINYYFVNHRALANGIVVAGSGVGGFGLPYLYRALIDEFLLPGALMIVGSIFLNICASALLLRQPQQLAKKKMLVQKDKELEEVKTENTNGQENQQSEKLLSNRTETKEGILKEQHENKMANCFMCRIFDWSLFKDPSYVIYVIGITLHITGYSANLTVLPGHIMSLNFGKQKVTIAVSVIGAAEIISRIFFGWFSDLKIFKVKHILLFTMIVSGITAVLVPFFRSFEALVIYGAIVGIFPGAFWSLMSVLVVECMGLERLPKAFGLMSLFLAFGVALSQPCAGWIEDATGSWDNSFRFAGVCNLLAAVVLLAEPIVVRYWCYNDKTKTEEEKVASDGEEEAKMLST